MADDVLKYQVKESKLEGRSLVLFQCPHCNEPLKESLAKAGEGHRCPVCGCAFKIPGSDHLQSKRQREAEEALSRQAELSREREEAAARNREATAAVGEQRRYVRQIAETSGLVPRGWVLTVGGVALLVILFLAEDMTSPASAITLTIIGSAVLVVGQVSIAIGLLGREINKQLRDLPAELQDALSRERHVKGRGQKNAK